MLSRKSFQLWFGPTKFLALTPIVCLVSIESRTAISSIRLMKRYRCESKVITHAHTDTSTIYLIYTHTHTLTHHGIRTLSLSYTLIHTQEIYTHTQTHTHLHSQLKLEKRVLAEKKVLHDVLP